LNAASDNGTTPSMAVTRFPTVPVRTGEPADRRTDRRSGVTRAEHFCSFR
jgi:hypothetical protein